RKSLGTIVELESAPLVWVEVDAHIFVRKGTDPEAAQESAVRRLRALFHPTREGGSRGFGATITVSQVAGLLQSLPGAVYVERVRLRRNGDTVEVTRIQPPPDSLLVLGRCYVLAEVLDE